MKSKMAGKCGKYRILIGFLLSCYLQGINGQSCTEDNIDQCIKPLEQYSDVLDGSIVPNHPVGVTKEICRTYRSVESCMKTFEHKCHPVNRRSFQGVHDSYKYLCVDHFDEYARHRECLATPELHEEGQACNLTLHFSFNSDSYQSGTSSYKAKRICQYAKTYLSCVENLVNSFCGEEAAQWQLGYDEASLEPILSYIGCQLNGDDGERSAIIAGVVLTFVLVAVFILVGVGIWMYGKKKHARDARNRRAARNGGPPGAGGGGSAHAVYRIGTPGSEGEVNISPYAYSTPSPVPPPYAEKPPAYGEQPPTQANGHAMANGHGLHGMGAMAAARPNEYEGNTTKMPLPPDYDPGEYQPPGGPPLPGVHVPPGGDRQGAGGAPSTMGGSEYLELQVPPEHEYEVIRGDSTKTTAGRAARHNTDSVHA